MAVVVGEVADGTEQPPHPKKGGLRSGAGAGAGLDSISYATNETAQEISQKRVRRNRDRNPCHDAVGWAHPKELQPGVVRPAPHIGACNERTPLRLVPGPVVVQPFRGWRGFPAGEGAGSSSRREWVGARRERARPTSDCGPAIAGPSTSATSPTTGAIRQSSRSPGREKTCSTRRRRVGRGTGRLRAA